jgi:NAD(P)-dependent dehydrogenase (short-subunit alcohol dehydrogenase family)
MGCRYVAKDFILRPMSKILDERIAIVTGASSGIGKAIALAFAREGAKVVIVADLNRNGLESTLVGIKQAGGQGIPIQLDVSNADEVRLMMDRVIAEYGRIDCAINNAGIEGAMASTIDCTEENWDRVIQVNLKGVWLCLKNELPHMLKQGKGAIVNMSSALGLVGIEGYPAYVASKHGVAGLTKAAALEYAIHGIRVNAICPGVIETPLLERMVSGKREIKEWLLAKEPIGRVGTPQEIAEAAVWLCSDASSFVTGHCMVVDGGALAQ